MRESVSCCKHWTPAHGIEKKAGVCMRGAYGGALVAEDGARELVEVAERVETAAFAELGAVEPHAIGGEVLDLDGIVGNCNSCVERGDARVLSTRGFEHRISDRQGY